MNRIKYFFAKIRLVFTACRAKSAKDLMNKVIISSRAKKEEIDYHLPLRKSNGVYSESQKRNP